MSACILPLAIFSPSRANGNNPSVVNGLSSNALHATTPATADAAELPMPDCNGIPVCITNSAPPFSLTEPHNVLADTEAVFSVEIFDNSEQGFPSISIISSIKIPLVLIRLAVTISPIFSRATPNISKPTATLPIDAGAKAFFI